MIIILMISLLVILFVLSIWFRDLIAELAGTAVDYTVGTWYRIWPAVRKALIVGGIGWGILIALMAGVGAYANSIIAALIISILFPFWFLSMLIPRRTPPVPFLAKWKIPIFGIVRVVGGIVLIIASISLAIGLWSPNTKGALNERFADSKTWTANFFKKDSAHSERNAGVRGRVKSATGVYDDFRKQIENKIVPAGKIIMILDFESKPATKDSEALSLVMLSNEHGNFVNGEKVWMPALKIEFVSNEEQNKDSAASAVHKESWELCWEQYKKPICINVEVKKTGRILIMEGGRFTFEGEESLGGEINGKWNDDVGNSEEFSLEFSPNKKAAKGNFKTSNSHRDVPMWLTKN